MIRNFFLTALFAAFFLPLSLSAQNHSLGPEIGLNFSNVSANSDYDGKTGLNLGLIYNYSSQENFGVGLGLLYSQEGFNLVNSDQSVDLDYLRIPVKFQYYFGSLEDALRPKIYAGPTLGFLLSDKDQFLPQDTANGFDLGLNFGGGLNYRLKDATWLNVDLSYNAGLTDVSNADAGIKNQNLRLGVGIAFGF